MRQRHITLEIQRIRPKAIHMFREIGTETGNGLIREVQAFREQLLEHTRLRLDVVENQTVGYHVPVLDDFALLITIILGNRPDSLVQRTFTTRFLYLGYASWSW